MKPVVANLKRLARDHDLLVIWTDCDREGEHIGAEVLGHCRQANPQIRCLRAKFSAIIPASVVHSSREVSAFTRLLYADESDSLDSLNDLVRSTTPLGTLSRSTCSLRPLST